FWDGRYDDAARAAYPLIEAGARGLLLALGEPIFRIETGNSEGRFPLWRRMLLAWRHWGSTSTGCAR
ncbi:hypothetical protein, partial [Sedimentibacter sp. B4]|uniref:hypothetical protein n=1 Tax=Sedimentibacter sp. B4 TaxID=304766 RepID=UPI00058F7E09